MKSNEAKNDKTLEDVKDFIRRAARKYNWAVVPDENFMHDLAQGLLHNYQRFGFYQCPCRDSYGEREHDRDIMCPCTYCSDDIEEYGQCYCGLFLSHQFAASEKFPEAIPERRPDEKFPY
ncbi:MAG: ferredoxin-thioredoxin reductase catalytic domain-containing protein [Spirochaetia bacterium]